MPTRKGAKQWRDRAREARALADEMEPGKTTVAMLLAGSLAGEGLRVVALDADPTQAFARWAANASEGAAFESHAEADETRLARLIDSTASNADVVIHGDARRSMLRIAFEYERWLAEWRKAEQPIRHSTPKRG